jgi:hypothetical protein
VTRKQAINDFKARKVPKGAFALRCAACGGVWVGSSTNLDAARNGLWFQLRTGSSVFRGLQQAWNQCGEQHFEFEVLETIPHDTPALNVNDLLKQKLRHSMSTIC